MKTPRFPMLPFRIVLWLPLLLCGGCDLLPRPKPREEVLPPETRTGADTFGCRVNGRVWLPKGKSALFSRNLEASYTTDYGGFLTVGAYRHDPATDTREDVGFVVDRVGRAPGAWTHAPGTGLRDQQPRFRYENRREGLDLIRSTDPEVYCRGRVVLTRLDMAAGIVSGTFEYVIKAPGHDTVRVTEGRFDYSYGF